MPVPQFPHTLRTPSPARQRGFTLIEALIGVLVATLAALGLQALQSTLTRFGDAARHVDEASRLAQAQLERMRAGATDIAPAESAMTTTQGPFQLQALRAGRPADAWTVAAVRVTWEDRAVPSSSGVAQDAASSSTPSTTLATTSLSLRTVLDRSAPELAGLAARPLPVDRALRTPGQRSLHIPAFALPLGGGLSAVPLAPDFTAIVRDDNAQVVQSCNPGTASPSTEQLRQLRSAGACTATTAMLVTGHIGRSGDDVPWPTGIDASAVVRQTAPAAAPIRCTLREPQLSASLTLAAPGAASRYHVCVIPLDAPRTWSGTLRLAGLPLGAGLVVCRHERAAPVAPLSSVMATGPTLTPHDRHVQPYLDVGRPLHQQNYLVAKSADGTCPAGMTVPGLATGVLHQDCRAADPALRATHCPA
jgi:Tfp pilus assembly protein PilV